MAHVADRILAEIKTRLAAVPGIIGVHVKPLSLLDSTDMPALVIDEIEDSVDERVGHFPQTQTRKLSFSVLICQMEAAADFAAAMADLHEATSLALFGSIAAINLGGLLTRGLSEVSATLFTDAESLEQPVGGWRIAVSCTYNLRSDQPGKTEKETS